MHASSWYKLNGATPDAPVSPLSDVVSAIINSLPVSSANKFASGQVAGSMLNPSVTTFLNNRDATGNSARPNSWLNIIVLDEQLKPVITSDGNNSYFAQVGASNSASVVQYNPSRAITKSGYVYIYVSNETPNIYTYWDNLQVTHVHGPLLQEEGYYSFGLEMKAISSAAAIKMQTNYKFNAGTNLESSFDVSYYETYFREYDAQIGRFTGIDSKAEANYQLTPYRFGFNNPISFNDPTGALEGAALEVWNAIVSHINAGGSINDIFIDGESVDFFYFGNGGGGGGLNYTAGTFTSNSFENVYTGLRSVTGSSPPVTPGLVKSYLQSTWGSDVWDMTVQTAYEDGSNGYSVDVTLPGDVTNYSGYFMSKINVENQLNFLYELNQGTGSRMPDYINANVSIPIIAYGILGINLSGSIDRYGKIYFSYPGIGLGKSYSTKVSSSLTANWLSQSTLPSSAQLNNFLTSNSFSAGGGYWIGGGGAWSPGNGFSYNMGLYTPQFGGSWNYTPNAWTWDTNIKW